MAVSMLSFSRSSIGRAFAAVLTANCLFVGPSAGQTLSLEDFAAKVDQRAGTLSGFQAYLSDPDPLRAMAALQVMLESGDQTLVQMALSAGIYSADSNVRQAALKAFLAGKPTLDLFLDGSGVPDEHMETYNRIMHGFEGSIGADKRAGISRKVGDWSDQLGCWTNLNVPEACLLRVNATTMSVYLTNQDGYVPSQWVHLTLSDDGTLQGGLLLSFNGQNIAPVGIEMRLSE
jgi:hypothetical protein